MSIFNLFKKEVTPSSAQSSSEQTTDSQTLKQDTITSIEKTSENHDGIKRVHNLIILDESGSMQSIYHPALSGVNETLQTIRGAQNDHAEQQHSVSLVAFDSGHYNSIYFNTPAAKAFDITEEQYRPNGGTPLYDAMGRSITQLCPLVKPGDIVLVTIITDGYENASHKYDCKTIKSLVEEMKNQGWVFTYIGANQDVEAVASSMSIDNHLAFEADDDSTYGMFEKECRSRKKFFSKLGHNMSVCDLNVGYFDEDDDNIHPDAPQPTKKPNL